MNLKKQISWLTLPLLFWAVISCSEFGREKLVDKTNLNGYDYRLFQGTPAWGLAKAVEDGDLLKINLISRMFPSLVNFRENKYGQPLLMLTVENNQLDALCCLLENNADINIHDNFSGASAIIKACSFDDAWLPIVECLVQSGADPNDIEIGPRKNGSRTRFTPLHAACFSGNFDIVKYLIENGADVNFKNEYNTTALSWAMGEGDYEIAYLLLVRGADFYQPIFYRPVTNVASYENELRPVYISDLLKEQGVVWDFNQNHYKKKIEEFLEDHGVI